MNNQLQEYARETLKQELSQCTEEQKLLFKRMYSHKNITLSINEVVDKMPEDKLDWAMQQVVNTLNKAGTK